MSAFLFRLALMGVSFSLWFYSQKLIGKKGVAHSHTDNGQKIDFSHRLLAAPNAWLARRPKVARGLLVASSLGVDAFALYIILGSLLGASLKPFVAMMLVFVLRQISQFVVTLPVPKSMIWFDPGVPSLFVTYGVSNDFFFSGHTALAVLGALLIGHFESATWAWTAGLVALFEVLAVLVFRAHWFVDVWVGALVSIAVYAALFLW